MFEFARKRQDIKVKSILRELMESHGLRENSNQSLRDWAYKQFFPHPAQYQLEDWRMYEYQQKFGFQVAVDCLHNTPGKQAGVLGVVFSLNPPGDLYDPQPADEIETQY